VWNPSYSGGDFEVRREVEVGTPVGRAPIQSLQFQTRDSEIPENEAETWSGVRSHLDAILGVLSGGRWSSIRGRQWLRGAQARSERRKTKFGEREEAKHLQKLREKGEVEDEAQTLHRSMSGYFKASEEFSETDDETPKPGRSESKLLKSAIRWRSPSTGAWRRIEFQTAEKSSDKRQPVKTTPTTTEQGEGSKMTRHRDHSRSESRRRQQFRSRLRGVALVEIAPTITTTIRTKTIGDGEHQGRKQTRHGDIGGRGHLHRQVTPMVPPNT